MEAGDQEQILALPDPLPAGGLVLSQLWRSLQYRPAKAAYNLESMLLIKKNKPWLNLRDGRGNTWPWQPRTTEIFDVSPYSIYSLKPTKVKSIPTQQPPPRREFLPKTRILG